MTTNQTYTLKPGDTLHAVAGAHQLSLNALLAANPGIANPNLVQAGQVINLPVPVAASGQYDGIHPAPGTTTIDRGIAIVMPVTSTVANRSPALYNQVIDQLAVENNPRYLPGGGCTYCNIFVWDVTRAMGCPVPHWILPDGAIADASQKGAYEINIDEGAVWMRNYGVPVHGWQPATAAIAQQAANAGQPAVAIWANADGHGHTAVIRPGIITSQGPATAQAGGKNFNYGHLAEGFGDRQPLFYVHA